MELTPRRISGNSPHLGYVLHLMRDCFAYMEGRIDPPSSLGQTTLPSLQATADRDEIWAIGAPPVACVVLSVKPAVLYLGKLCVAPSHQRLGLARHLITHAESRARALYLGQLELQTRVELLDNHATFRALGFHEYARTAHAGFDRPTSITLRKTVA